MIIEQRSIVMQAGRTGEHVIEPIPFAALAEPSRVLPGGPYASDQSMAVFEGLQIFYCHRSLPKPFESKHL